MGLSYNVYIGPFIQAKPILVKITQSSIDKFCLNTQCSVFKKMSQVGNFCSYCKNDLKCIESDKFHGPDPYELIGEYLTEQSSFMNETGGWHFFIPNIDWNGVSHSFNPTREDVDAKYDLTSLDIQDEIQKFAEFFEDDIETLKKHYDPFYIKWGVLNTMI